MLGSGELGKEVVIELQRLGLEVIACDRYANAPAMQVADRSYTFSMLDSEALRQTIESERPDLIVPEIEAIATDTLVELESEGFTVIPSARAARLTMNREGIRRLAAALRSQRVPLCYGPEAAIARAEGHASSWLVSRSAVGTRQSGRRVECVARRQYGRGAYYDRATARRVRCMGHRLLWRAEGKV